jgi:hypothetical protein
MLISLRRSAFEVANILILLTKDRFNEGRVSID